MTSEEVVQMLENSRMVTDDLGEKEMVHLESFIKYLFNVTSMLTSLMCELYQNAGNIEPDVCDE